MRRLLDETKLLNAKKKLLTEKALLEANAKTDALIAALGIFDKEMQAKFWAILSITLSHEPYKSGLESINERLEEIEEELKNNEPGMLH